MTGMEILVISIVLLLAGYGMGYIDGKNNKGKKDGRS